MRSPERIRSGRAQIWIGAVYAIVVLALILLLPADDPRPLVPLVALGPVWIIQGVVERKTRVEIGATGVTVYTPRFLFLRSRSVSWPEVQELRIDPPGGPRSVRLRLTSGGEVSLLPLTDSDNESVRRAHETASTPGTS